MNNDNGLAKKLAAALTKAGITNDTPEVPPNPTIAAFQAFLSCNLGSKKADWDDLLELLGAPSSAQYYQKMADLCHRALRRHDVTKEFFESYLFGWGYFTAQLEREIASGTRGGSRTE